MRWCTLENNNGAAPESDANHLPGTHHPADVRDPEKDIFWLNIIGESEFFSNLRKGTCVCVHASLGFSCRTRSVEVHRWMLCRQIHFCRCRNGRVDDIVKPDVSSFNPIYFIADMLEHNYMLETRQFRCC